MAEPKDMADAMIATFKKRTGRTLEEWVELVETTSGVDPLDQRGVRAWLRDVHGLKQNSQWAVAFEVAGRAGWTMPTASEFANKLFSGPKAELRDLHDAVITVAAGLPDAEVQARATYTPVVRRTQFIAVAPGPRGTLRVGLRYKGHAPEDDRLSPAKGFAPATHWIHLPGDAEPTSAAEAIADLIEAAWEQNS